MYFVLIYTIHIFNLYLSPSILTRELNFVMTKMQSNPKQRTAFESAQIAKITRMSAIVERIPRNAIASYENIISESNSTAIPRMDCTIWLAGERLCGNRKEI